MKRRGHKRKGGFIKRLTKKAKQYTLIYVQTRTKQAKSLGIFSSLDEAKKALFKYTNIEAELLEKGIYYIFSDGNRVEYSTERGIIDAE